MSSIYESALQQQGHIGPGCRYTRGVFASRESVHQRQDSATETLEGNTAVRTTEDTALPAKNLTEDIDLKERKAHSLRSNQQRTSTHALHEDRNENAYMISGEPKSRDATDADTQVPRQITYLIALTDEVLTKRTQMDHEEETLFRHQQYLNESSYCLLNAFTDILPRIDHQGGTARRPDHDRRSPDSPKYYSEATYTPSTVRPLPAQTDQETQASEGVADDIISQAIENVQFTAAPPDPIDVLWAHYRKYQSDYEALNLRRARLTGLRTELTTLEYRLRKRQDEFLLALSSMRSVMPEFGSQVLADASEAMGSFEPSEKSQSDPPSLLALYFDRKGDIGIYKERLVELDYHYQEGLVERELIWDRGDEHETTDEQFRADYTRSRRNIQRDLEVAEREAAALEAECHAAGIDTFNTTRRASPSTEASRPHSLDIQLEGADYEHYAFVEQTRLGSRSRGRRKTQIEGWLEAIPVGSQSDEEEGHPIDPEENERELASSTSKSNVGKGPIVNTTHGGALYTTEFDDT